MNKKKLLLPVVFLAAALAGFAALKATRPVQTVAPPKEPVWRVSVQTVAPGSHSAILTLNGKVESPEFTQAAAPGMGRVVRLPAREGQAVKKGSVLLALDERDFAPKVAQARGAVEELDAAIRSEHLRHKADLDQLEQERKLLDFANADVARFERLQKENFYSQTAVDQSRASLSQRQITLRGRELTISDHEARLAQLNARRMQAQANLDQARLALERSRVTAPFDGYVAKVLVAVGDQVNTGQTLISLYPSAALEVRAKIPAAHQDGLLALLARGAHPVALASGGVKLQLDRAASAADARGLDGFFRVVDAGPGLRLGSLITVEMALPPVADAIAVPYDALYNGRTVYRVEGDRLKAVAVETVGELAGAKPMLLVRGGLAQGDRLMVTHLPNAVTGLKVEVAAAGPAAGKAGLGN